MELTPIRVRGKRRAGGEYLPVAPPTKRLRRAPNQKKKPKAHRSQPSYLERSLPLEVLEYIFWLSENINFPRASPRLGRLLSGPSTLRETFLSAFGPTWEVWFGCFNGRDAGYIDGPFPMIHSYAGWEEDADRFGGNPNFQTDLLACSWTTIDMILDCRDIWVRRHAQARPFEYIALWGCPNGTAFIHRSPSIGNSDIKEARCYFYHDYGAFRHEKMIPLGSRELGMFPFHGPWIEVHRSAEIPDDLITGPWDEGSLQKLFWLMQAGARLSPNQTWEVTLEGFRNATSDRNAPNMTALKLLHVLGAFLNWPKHIREEEKQKVRGVMLNQKEFPLAYPFILGALLEEPEELQHDSGTISR
ncbi:hypothetical protein F5Y10DRAFT_224310 [Nemania abortiva]|nr:hypothetical protein F5Y10DRAFT_224310 [Nemania abortiva]